MARLSRPEWSDLDKYQDGRPSKGGHQSQGSTQLNFTDTTNAVMAMPNQPQKV